MPATATKAETRAAAKTSQPLDRAGQLDDACHGQTTAWPASEKALGKAHSSTRDTPVAAKPIRPSQTSSTPRRFTSLRTASASAPAGPAPGDGRRWPGCIRACRPARRPGDESAVAFLYVELNHCHIAPIIHDLRTARHASAIDQAAGRAAQGAARQATRRATAQATVRIMGKATKRATVQATGGAAG